MKIKDGVIMSSQRVMRKVLIKADELWREYDEELVVTSGIDGTHSAGSYHYYGYAYDFRTRYFSEEQSKNIAIELQTRLDDAIPKMYKVVWEPTHIHVQAEMF
jgi:hypothetical protein